MQLIGLTGGVASGKSTAAMYLEGRGIPVIDADRLAREALSPGQAAYHRVCRRFPAAVGANGVLDRARLAELVFSDRSARRALEAIIHPVVRWRMALLIGWHWLRGCARVVLDVPLLFETRMDRWVSFSVLITASPATQLARLARREGWSPEHCRARIASQMTPEERIRRADIVIANDADDRAALHAQLEHLVVGGRRPNFFVHRILLHPLTLLTMILTALSVTLQRTTLLKKSILSLSER